jgi:hypothetical protein
MKKGLSLFAGLALSASLFAQLAPGSTAPNWTFTDLNNNSWTLYNLTAQGKTVFIDVSATWCGPCWNYHNTHALRDVYDQYGPTGTIVPGEVMVFFIEGDASTTIADLNGTGGNTQGNWVTGTTYPIIDPGNYNIGYFPTVYKVCPDNKIYEVGQASAQGLLNSINSCTFANDAYATAGPVALQCATTFSPTFELKNNGTTVMTACTITYSYDGGPTSNQSWSGSLAAGATTTVTLPSNTFTAGAHTLTVTTTLSGDNNNTNNTQTYSFNVNTAAGTAAPLVNSFASTGFPYANWILSNPDNGITWTRSTTNSGSLKMDCYNYGTQGAIDEFYIEPVDMSTLTTPSLQFKVAHRIYSANYTERLEVLVSSDCGATWSNVYNKAGSTLASVAGASTSAFTPSATQWRSECIDLSSFAGQNKVFVKFKCTNDYGNNVWVDDINISNTPCATGVAENTNIKGLSMFPNPANTTANINFELTDKQEVSVNVYNSLGALVYTENKGTLAAGQQNIILNTEAYANGIYMIELVTGDMKTVSRLSVNH